MNRIDAKSVRERPAYTIGEAAHYLRMSPRTLDSWVLGRRYPTAGGDKYWPPLVEIADKKERLLSFMNLVEANVLTAVRKDHGVAMANVRAALEYVRSQLSISRPLSDAKFATDGVSLFIDRYGDLVNASRHGQMTLRGMLDAALRRIERADPNGVPIRLFAKSANDNGQSKYVAFDPTIAFGRPALVHAGAPVAVIANRFRGGDSIEFLAEDYAVEREAIEEAIRQATILRAA